MSTVFHFNYIKLFLANDFRNFTEQKFKNEDYECTFFFFKRIKIEWMILTTTIKYHKPKIKFDTHSKKVKHNARLVRNMEFSWKKIRL